jgi:membrane-associated protease RseP (regulator of RpoE activity)
MKIKLHWSISIALIIAYIILLIEAYLSNYFKIFTLSSILGMCLFGAIVTTLIIYVSVFLHELGHYCVCRLMKIPTDISIEIHSLYGKIYYDDADFDNFQRFLITLGGPVANLILSGLFFILYSFTKDFYSSMDQTIKFIYTLNLYAAIGNLLPFDKESDGGILLSAATKYVTRSINMKSE